MDVSSTTIEDVLIIKPKIYKDNRGYFIETHHLNRYSHAGISCSFVQDNMSYSTKGCLRGLHFQKQFPQDKMVQVIQGEIFDVALDIRLNSSTFGQWTGVRLSDKNHWQIFIPKGFAHGFCVLSETAIVYYKCSDYYHPEDEYGLLWSDPDLNIQWPVMNPIVSEKDKNNQLFQNYNPH